MATLNTLHDDFNGTLLDDTIWSDSGTVEVKHKRLYLTVNSGTANTSAITSAATYNGTNTWFSTQLVDAGDQSLATFGAYPVFLSVDANNSVSTAVTSSEIRCQKTVAGVSTDVETIDYDPAVHKFFRIRELSGTMYWGYSTNGDDWTTIHSESTPITMTSVYAGMVALTWGTEATGTRAIFDNANTEADIPGNKTVLYKVYSNAGEYLGVMPNVTSDLEYSLDENTLGTSITMEIAADLTDVGAEYEYSKLLISADDHLLIDDSAGRLIIDSDVVYRNIPIQPGNKVVAWLYYDDAPNGIKKFSGIITRWKFNQDKGNIMVTVIHEGAKASHKMLRVLTGEELTGSSTSDDFAWMYPQWKTSSSVVDAVAQTFDITSDSDSISIYLSMKVSVNSVPTAISIYSGTPASSGALMATVTPSVTSETAEMREYVFSAPVEFAIGEYYFEVINEAFSANAENNLLGIEIDTTNPYADGTMWQRNQVSGWSQVSGSDIKFSITASTGGTTNTFSSADPSDILREVLDNFQGQGGQLTYTADSIENTGYTVTDTFSFMTIAEAIARVPKLSPPNWYYYVDLGTNVLYWKRQQTTIDHTIVMGKHVNNIDVGEDLEGVVNEVAFSGGEVAPGENLVRVDSNQSSVSRYGSWLDISSDNRVKLDSTADIVVETKLTRQPKPITPATVIVPAALYDIELFQVSQMVAFRGAGNLIDDLVLRIAALDYKTDVVVLHLSAVPAAFSRRIEDIRRNLALLETEKTPDEQSA